jgi:hypothetical protein
MPVQVIAKGQMLDRRLEYHVERRKHRPAIRTPRRARRVGREVYNGSHYRGL